MYRELPIVVAQSVLGVKLSRKAKVLQLSNHHTYIDTYIYIYINLLKKFLSKNTGLKPAAGTANRCVCMNQTL